MTDTLNHRDLVSALVKPGEVIADEMTSAEADLWHGATGVSTESGELLENALAVEISGEWDRENTVEELGDMEFYLEQVRQNLGITRESLMDVVLEYQISNEFFAATAILCVGANNLLDLAKKVAIYKKDVARQQFIEALARLDVTMNNLYSLTDITREEAIAGNIAKLSVRYSSGSFSNEQAQARADKADGE